MDIDLKKILSDMDAAILYQPIGDEIDITIIPFLKIQDSVTVPADKNADPYYWAEKCIEKYNGKKVCIVIPGRKFDMHGTRHGKGGGWYDRFLSKIPREWLRIGIATKEHFSSTPLARNEWDEPMDYVVVQNSDSWEIYKTDVRGQE